MKVGIGSDEAGFCLKSVLIDYLTEKGYEVFDHGVYSEAPSLYPDAALRVAQGILDKKQERGIVICGTGIGMAMTANKIPGIRAAQCHDVYSAERAKNSNDAQIITMGQRVVGPELAKMIAEKFLSTEGVKPSSVDKIDRMMEIEKSFL